MQSILNEADVFSSIVDAISAAGKTVKKTRNDNSSKYMSGSISKYSQKLVMSFPMLCDNTVSIETAQMISKAHEKNLVSMFELLFSAMSFNSNNGVEILQMIHKNIGGSAMDIDEIIDKIEQLTESTNISEPEMRYYIEQMKQELRNSKSFPVDSFSENSVNDYVVRSSYGRISVTEASKKDTKKEEDEEKQARDRFYDDLEVDSMNDYGDSPYGDIAKDNRERDRERREVRKEKIDRRKAKQEEERKDREEKRQAARDAASDSRDVLSLAQNRVKDGDYKKANELQPTLMTVSFNEMDDNGNISPNGKKSFVCGVKSRMVGAPAEEIASRVSAFEKTSLSLKNLIKAITGETKFVKDFILAVKQAKIDAINGSKSRSAAMWKVLEKRAAKNNANRISKSNDASAITTLLINQETVNYIKQSSKVDLNDVSAAIKFMGSYNLLCLVIADDVNEVAKFLYDGNNSFENLSYVVLSKEAAERYKKNINLVSKGR